MPAPHVELSRAAVPNEMGHVVLAFAERVLAPRDLAGLRSVVAESRALVDAFPRYRDWVTGSFLRQGDHANVVEYFADIPTNFRDAHQLPPPIAAHFAPLIDGSPFPSEFDTALADGGNDLAAFQRSLAPA